MTTENQTASPAAQNAPTPPAPHETRPPNPGEGRTKDPALPDPIALPDLDGLALFLDLDGTLLDLAATPDQVTVEPGLCDLLLRLEDRLSGALALVTGRRPAFVDGLFPDHRFTVAGLHGVEIRPGTAAGAAVSVSAAPHSDQGALRAAHGFMQRAAAAHPGLLAEDKGAAFALHYRQAPELRGLVERIMAEALVIAGPSCRLRDGKFVVELGPAGADKGGALRNLMAARPFTGRTPLAAGDDLTDEAMFEVAKAMGGLAILIGDRQGPTAATRRIATPAAFRSWLHHLAVKPAAQDRRADTHGAKG